MDWRRWPASVKIYVAAVVGVRVPVYGWALYQSIVTAVAYPPDKLVSLLGILFVAGLRALGGADSAPPTGSRSPTASSSVSS
jgi:hypothetical protein